MIPTQKKWKWMALKCIFLQSFVSLLWESSAFFDRPAISRFLAEISTLRSALQKQSTWYTSVWSYRNPWWWQQSSNNHLWIHTQFDLLVEFKKKTRLQVILRKLQLKVKTMEFQKKAPCPWYYEVTKLDVIGGSTGIYFQFIPQFGAF